MPTISYSKIEVRGDFESSEAACEAIRTVMQGGGYQPMPSEPRALPSVPSPVKTLDIPAALEATPVPKPEAEPRQKRTYRRRQTAVETAPPKAVKLKRGKSAPVQEPAPDAPRKRLADHILDALTDLGAMNKDQIFSALKKEGVSTTEGSVYGVTRNLVQAGKVEYDDETGKYSVA